MLANFGIHLQIIKICDKKTTLLTLAWSLGKVEISANIILTLNLLKTQYTSSAHVGFI